MSKRNDIKDSREVIETAPGYLYAYSHNDGTGKRYVFEGYGALKFKQALELACGFNVPEGEPADRRFAPAGLDRIYHF